MKCVLFLGSFDFFIKGYLDIVECVVKLFDEVVIGVFINILKNSLFFLEERMILIVKVVVYFFNVKVIY